MLAGTGVRVAIITGRRSRLVALRARELAELGFSEDGIVDAVEKAADVYLAEREEGERFLDTYRRIGMTPFKEALYA